MMILFEAGANRQSINPTFANTIKRVKLMEHQLCTTIDIDSPAKRKPRPITVRNRRFRKLQ